MDIKAKVEEIVEKLRSNPALLSGFQSEPVKTVETLLGIDLPDEALGSIVAGVKARLGAEQAADALGALKKLF